MSGKERDIHAQLEKVNASFDKISSVTQAVQTLDFTQHPGIDFTEYTGDEYILRANRTANAVVRMHEVAKPILETKKRSIENEISRNDVHLASESIEHHVAQGILPPSVLDAANQYLEIPLVLMDNEPLDTNVIPADVADSVSETAIRPINPQAKTYLSDLIKSLQDLDIDEDEESEDILDETEINGTAFISAPEEADSDTSIPFPQDAPYTIVENNHEMTPFHDTTIDIPVPSEYQPNTGDQDQNPPYEPSADNEVNDTSPHPQILMDKFTPKEAQFVSLLCQGDVNKFTSKDDILSSLYPGVPLAAANNRFSVLKTYVDRKLKEQGLKVQLVITKGKGKQRNFGYFINQLSQDQPATESKKISPDSDTVQQDTPDHQTPESCEKLEKVFLTARENEILQKATSGMSPDQIAEDLNISFSRVQSVLHVIKQRLGASDLVDLKIAVQNNNPDEGYEIQPKSLKDFLSKYETAILTYYAQGLKPKQIAEKLGKSPSTIGSVLSRALSAAGISSTYEAIFKGYDQGIYTPEQICEATGSDPQDMLRIFSELSPQQQKNFIAIATTTEINDQASEKIGVSKRMYDRCKGDLHRLVGFTSRAQFMLMYQVIKDMRPELIEKIESNPRLTFQRELEVKPGAKRRVRKVKDATRKETTVKNGKKDSEIPMSPNESYTLSNSGSNSKTIGSNGQTARTQQPNRTKKLKRILQRSPVDGIPDSDIILDIKSTSSRLDTLPLTRIVEEKAEEQFALRPEALQAIRSTVAEIVFSHFDIGNNGSNISVRKTLNKDLVGLVRGILPSELKRADLLTYGSGEVKLANEVFSALTSHIQGIWHDGNIISARDKRILAACHSLADRNISYDDIFHALKTHFTTPTK